MNVREMVFSMARLESRAADAGRAVLRVGAGLALALAHGMGKMPPSDRFIQGVGEMGLPAPAFFAWMSGFAEFFCGLLLAVGLATRPAALFVSLNMFVVVFLAHAGDPFGNRERGVLFLCIALFFLLAGAGRYSFDQVISRPRLTTRV